MTIVLDGGSPSESSSRRCPPGVHRGGHVGVDADQLVTLTNTYTTTDVSTTSFEATSTVTTQTTAAETTLTAAEVEAVATTTSAVAEGEAAVVVVAVGAAVLT